MVGPSQLLQILYSRRDAIADRWYQAISRVSYIPLEPAEVRRRLAELTAQTIALLTTEPLNQLDQDEARAIGVALAQLTHAQPQALGRTQEVLSRLLLEPASPEQAEALLSSLVTLFGAMATGFLRQTRDIILAEQEQIRRAFVSEIRKTEQALRRSEGAVRALLDAPGDLAVLVDLDGMIVAANGVLAQGLGQRADELVGTCVFDLFPPSVAEQRRNQGSQVIHSGTPLRFETEWRGRWFDQRIYPVLDAGGDVVQLAIFAREITGHKRMQDALRESRARYQMLFENAPIGMGVVDARGRVLAVNDALLSPLGYAPEDVANIESIAELCYDPGERERVLDVIDNRGFLRQREMRIKGKDGAYCHMLLSLVPITWKGEHCWQVMALDVTARKQAERQVSRAERMAAMGRMAMALAHEINNPLQAIRSNLELVHDFDLQPDEQARYLDIVHREVGRLSKISRRILDFAQPADETRHPVSIARLTDRALQLLGKQLELANIQTTTDFPADLPPVFVAPDQIGQVLLNLAVNAIEAMPDGGHLHIAARVDGDAVALVLTNDGPPIPGEDLRRVFDPFFTTKRRGTGMGLPLSHSIVDRHGGTIRVENLEGGRGVACTVTLPIALIPR